MRPLLGCACLWACCHLALALRLEPQRTAGAAATPKADTQTDSVAPRNATSTSTAKVFYLFLVESDFEQEAIWTEFFKGQERSKFEAFVHCTTNRSCLQNQSSDLWNLVPTVPSEYCSDLVNPMVALLAGAYQSSRKLPNPDDPGHKFVFLSHNSVPIKPFSEVQQRLIKGKQGLAHFEWYPHCGGLKSGLWSVLSASHVEKILKDRGGGPSPTLDNVFVNKWRFWPGGCGGCADEQYFITTLYGNNTESSSLKDMTYWWIDWKSRKAYPLLDTNAGPFGPGTVVDFSIEGLCVVRRTDQLFLRKVAPSAGFIPQKSSGRAGLQVAFRDFVFSSSSPCLDSKWDQPF